MALVAHWVMDEAAGATAADSSGNGNTLPLVNAPVFLPAGGYFNGALDFEDASSQYGAIVDGALVGAIPSKNAGGATDFTIAAWVNPESLNNRKPIVTKQTSIGGGIQRGFAFMIGEGTFLNQLYAEVYESDTISTKVGSVTNLATGVWQHVAVTYKFIASGTSELRFYIDGAQTAAYTNVIGPIQGNAKDLNVGAYIFSGGYQRYFDGLIDDLRIYDETLSAAAVSALTATIAASFTFSAVSAPSALSSRIGIDSSAGFVEVQLPVTGPDGSDMIVHDTGFSFQPRPVTLSSSAAPSLTTLADNATLAYCVYRQAANEYRILRPAIVPPPNPFQFTFKTIQSGIFTPEINLTVGTLDWDMGDTTTFINTEAPSHTYADTTEKIVFVDFSNDVMVDIFDIEHEQITEISSLPASLMDMATEFRMSGNLLTSVPDIFHSSILSVISINRNSLGVIPPINTTNLTLLSIYDNELLVAPDISGATLLNLYAVENNPLLTDLGDLSASTVLRTMTANDCDIIIFPDVFNSTNLLETDFARNNLPTAELDKAANGFWANRAIYTRATPILRLNGNPGTLSGNVAAPPGASVSNADWSWNGTGHDPLTPGAKAYDLVNDVRGEGFNTWIIDL